MAKKVRKLKVHKFKPSLGVLKIKKVEVPKPAQNPFEVPSAGKDFTDIILCVLDAGDRVFHLAHIRNTKFNRINGTFQELNGHKYLLHLDRAFPTNWRSWKMYDFRHPIRTINEYMRFKKVGLLPYQEPCTHKCSGCQLLKDDPDACKKIPTLIEPLHISRVHQPTGKLTG